jgi:hypothetical protein
MWPVALDRLGSVSVNGGRILTLWRRLKIDPCMVVFDLLVVGCGGRGDAAEVSVFEPVAVSFEAMTSAWWTSRSIMAADYVVAEDLTPAKGLLKVTMRLARSYRAETSWKNRLAASGSKGM